jgi:translation elongation factor EF-G
MTLKKLVNDVEVDMTAEEEAAIRAEWDAASQPTRDQLKTVRDATVAAITVTVGDKVFDGDEVSQGRMARALRVADITGQTTCTWVLHDNTSVTVTKEELGQALALAMQAQAAVWVI